MGITTAMCTSFKSEVLGGTHDLDTHTLKLALIKSGSLVHTVQQQLITQMLQVTLTKQQVLTTQQVDKT